jgi:hypothetical protein
MWDAILRATSKALEEGGVGGCPFNTVDRLISSVMKS